MYRPLVTSAVTFFLQSVINIVYLPTLTPGITVKRSYVACRKRKKKKPNTWSLEHEPLTLIAILTTAAEKKQNPRSYNRIPASASLDNVDARHDRTYSNRHKKKRAKKLTSPFGGSLEMHRNDVIRHVRQTWQHREKWKFYHAWVEPADDVEAISAALELWYCWGGFKYNKLNFAREGDRRKNSNIKRKSEDKMCS